MTGRLVMWICQRWFRKIRNIALYLSISYLYAVAPSRGCVD